MEALNESGLVPGALQMINRTVVRAHHPATGAKGGLRDRVLAVQVPRLTAFAASFCSGSTEGDQYRSTDKSG